MVIQSVSMRRTITANGAVPVTHTRTSSCACIQTQTLCKHVIASCCAGSRSCGLLAQLASLRARQVSLLLLLLLALRLPGWLHRHHCCQVVGDGSKRILLEGRVFKDLLQSLRFTDAHSQSCFAALDAAAHACTRCGPPSPGCTHAATQATVGPACRAFAAILSCCSSH